MLRDFEKKLQRLNPGAGSIIEQHLHVDGVTMADISATLRDTVPKIIAKTYDPAASAGVIDAQVQDIVTAMERAAGHYSSSSGLSRTSSQHSSDREDN